MSEKKGREFATIRPTMLNYNVLNSKHIKVKNIIIFSINISKGVFYSAIILADERDPDARGRKNQSFDCSRVKIKREVSGKL